MDETWGEDEWKRDLNRDVLNKMFEKWTDTPVKRGMIDVSLHTGATEKY